MQSTGVQVLFAFLLTLPFSAGFGRVDLFGRWLFHAALGVGGRRDRSA